MNPIAQLKKEHAAVRVALAILDRLADLIVRSPSAEAVRDLERLMGFLEVFVDRCHHAKEEKMLFPVLEEVGVAREKGPLGVMLAEHRQGREAIRGMLASLPGVRRQEPQAAATFAEYARAYAALLDRHLEKENAVLFAFAESHLTTLQLNRLEADFARLEEELGRNPPCSGELEELSAKYLGRTVAGPAAGSSDQ